MNYLFKGFALFFQKKCFILSIALCFISTISATERTLSPELIKKIKNEIDTMKTWASLPILVNAVKVQNNENLLLDEIKKRDVEWIKITESKSKPNDLMINLQNHPAGQWLKNQRKLSNGKYRECFLCDNKGANVAISNITSDYFQGDEYKWIACFNNGNGNAIYEEPEYDSSSDAILIQISVPVKDKEKTIGVLIVGISFSKIKKN